MEWIINTVYYVIPFLLLLGVLVFVHEFGHFIVARKLGVSVSAFSIGFGKELWRGNNFARDDSKALRRLVNGNFAVKGKNLSALEFDL